jgi:hypothetical protein
VDGSAEDAIAGHGRNYLSSFSGGSRQKPMDDETECSVVGSV